MGLQGIALACARHPWRTIVAWIAVVVLAILAIGALLGGALTTEGNPTNDPQSQPAEDALAAAFPPTVGAAVSDVIVIRSGRYQAHSPRFDMPAISRLPVSRQTCTTRSRFLCSG